MSFTELTFVFFLLPLTVISALALKWLKSSKIKNIIMLVLSVGIFAYYSWKLLAVFAVFIVLVYLVGQLVYTARSEDSSKKRWMIIGVSALVFTLFYSKYFPAIISWWNGFHVVRLNYVSIIPIAGISFITFLQGGEYYAYSFNLNKLAKTHIVISEFRVYGPGATIPFEQSILSDPGSAVQTDPRVTGSSSFSSGFSSCSSSSLSWVRFQYQRKTAMPMMIT